MASRAKPNGRCFKAGETLDDPGKEPLLAAIRSGTKDDVERILGPDSQPSLLYQETLDIALLTACESKNKCVVEILLRSGAKTEEHIVTIFEHLTKGCFTSQDMELMQILVVSMDKNKNECRRELLTKAVRFGSYDLVKLLCQHFVDPGNDYFNETLLSEASSKGRNDLLELLLPSFKNGINKNQSSSLFQALQHGHNDCIETLIKHGRKIDATKAIEAAIKGNTFETLKLFPQLYKTAFQNIKCISSMLYRVDGFKSIEFLKFMLESQKIDELLIYAKNTEDFRFLIDHGAVLRDSVEICRHILDLIRRGDSEMSEAFFSAGINVNSQNFKTGLNGTPLTVARNAKMVQFLIDKGADMNERVYIKRKGGKKVISTTPILEALWKNEEVLKALLDNGADPDVTYSNGYSALMAVSEVPFGDSKVEMLLKAGACVNRQGKMGETALSLATSKENSRSVKLLLQYGADVNLQNSNTTVLLNAMTRNYLMLFGNESFKIIEMLAQSGVNTTTLDMSDINGNTPLILAVKSFTDAESSKLINIFANAGADLNKRDSSGFTALMIASRRIKYLALKALIEAGADINASLKLSNATLSPLSVWSNDLYFPRNSHMPPKMVELLVKGGVNTCLLNALNENGDTLLIMTVRSFTDAESSKLIDIFATAGADLNKPDSDGYTALLRAAQYDKLLVLKALIEAGADVNTSLTLKQSNATQETDTSSPLCVALQESNEGIARFLVGNRCLNKSDILFKFKSKCHHSECKEFLTELTAQPFSLLTLSFVQVSSSLGSGPAREERVKKTGLPPMLQRKLLFKGEEVFPY